MRSPKALSGYDIIMLAPQMYHDRWWGTFQNLACRAAKRNRVLYVEANYSFQKLALGVVGRRWPVAPLGRLRRVQDGLHVLTPPPRLPLRLRTRLLGLANQRVLKSAVLPAVRALRFDRIVLWSFLFQSGALVGSLGEVLSIYHCVDEWSKMPFKLASESLIRKQEEELARRCNVVLASATTLRDRLARINPNTFYVPNGADISLFEESRRLAPAAELRDIPRPRVGYAGSLAEWIDYSLLAHLARTLPDVSFVFVGYVEPRIRAGSAMRRLKRLSNVYFLGLKSKEEVPRYLAGFDACLVPFLNEEVTRAVSPLKFFEYLAMGKPIVAPRLPELLDYTEAVYFYEDESQGVEAVRRALNSEPPAAKERRIRMSKSCSWEARLDQIYGILERFLPGEEAEGRCTSCS